VSSSALGRVFERLIVLIFVSRKERVQFDKVRLYVTFDAFTLYKMELA
jgi:hypothetical protein